MHDTPTQDQAKPKRRKAFHLPQPLSAAHQHALLRVFDRRRPRELRNLCMVVVMLECGLRSAEVRALTYADLDWRSGRLHIREGKGRKDRVLGGAAIELLPLLRAWRDVSPGGTGPEDPIFTARAGRPMSASNLRTLVAAAGRRAKLPRRLHPHLLRHTFATELLRSNPNLRIVQRALGHAGINTTEVYTHISDPELERGLRAFSRRRRRALATLTTEE